MTHEYMRRLDKAIARGLVDRKGLYDVRVSHDDWCGIYGGKDCDCEPDITVVAESGRAVVDGDGKFTR